jgi:hypothetical protein
MTRALAHDLPSEDSAAGTIARRLGRLLGPAVQAPDDSQNAAELLALGSAFVGTVERLEQARDEAFPNTAEETLSEWELALGLAIAATNDTASRRSLLLAVTSTRRGGTPQDLLALARSVVPSAALREYTATEAAASGSARNVFTLRVIVGSSYGDTEKQARITALLRPALPAHCALEFGELEYDAIEAEDSSDLETELGSVLTEEF